MLMMIPMNGGGGGGGGPEEPHRSEVSLHFLQTFARAGPGGVPAARGLDLCAADSSPRAPVPPPV